MSVVAITSSRTSPGATTLAAGLAIAWSHQAERSVLIEADPAGGVLALRFELAPAPSLTSFGSDVRNGFSADLLWSNTQELRGTQCIPAPVDPVLARTWIDRVTPTLIEELPRLGSPVVLDLGWVDHDGASAKLASAADTTLIVTRPDIAEVQALLFQVERLQAMDTNVAIVTIGDSPNDPAEIARLAGVPLAAVLPDDPKIAAALGGGQFKPSKFRRSMLWRTIGGLAESLFDPALLEHRAAASDAIADEGPATDSVEGFQNSRGVLAELSPEALSSNPPLPSRLAAATLPPPAGTIPATVGSVPAGVVSAPMPPPPTGSPVIAASAMPAPVSAPAPAPFSAPMPPLPLPTQSPMPSAPLPPPPSAPAPVAPTVAPAPLVITGAYPRTAQPVLASSPQPAPTVIVVPPIAAPVSAPAALLLATGEQHVLNPGTTFTIGRHSQCDIVLHDSEVSRHHGRLVQTSDGWHYADLGSRNGTALNAYPCSDSLLASGDVLTIGRSVITFETTPQREMECV